MYQNIIKSNTLDLLCIARLLQNETDREYRMNRKQIKKNNFPQVLTITLLFISLIAVTGVVVLRLYMNSFQEVLEEHQYQQYYVMITDDWKNSFWQAVYQGAYETGQAENIYVDLLGETFSTDYTKEDLMRIAISSRVDGIIVSADESEPLSELIDEAVLEGIPVVTVLGDNTQSSRCSFIGIGSYNLGREYGRQVLQIAEERKDTDLPVKVAVLVNSSAQDSGQNILCSGIQETLDTEKKQGTEIEMTLVSVDDTNAFSAEESIRDIFMGENLPDVIICLNELNTTCVYQAVVDYNKVGLVNILGYYDSDTIINGIDRNVIYATVSIDTMQMGAFCIEALSEYYELGNTSQYFTADITLINKNNVSLYMEDNDGE